MEKGGRFNYIAGSSPMHINGTNPNDKIKPAIFVGVCFCGLFLWPGVRNHLRIGQGGADEPAYLVRQFGIK